MNKKGESGWVWFWIILFFIIMFNAITPSYNSYSIYNNHYECNYNKYNCADFSSYSEARFVYYKCGGVSNDVHHLDGDKDGMACEALRWQ